MSPFEPLPLKTYDPAWEKRWEDEHKVSIAANRHLEEVDQALPIDWDRYNLALEAAQKSAVRLQAAFTAQFRTTDEYRDWQSDWLPTLLPWRRMRKIEARMHGGLPIREIRRRVNEAIAFGRQAASRGTDMPSDADAHQLCDILGAFPSGEVLFLAGLLRRGGGDYV